MKKLFNPCNVYLALWMMITVWAEIASSRFTAVFIAFMLLVSLFYFIYANIHYKLPKYFTYLNLLFVLFSFYAILLIISGNVYTISFTGDYRQVNNRGYIMSIGKSLLPIYAFYVFRKQKMLTEKTLKFWIVVFFIVAGIQYYYGNLFIQTLAEEAGISIENYYNNQGYLILALVPCIVFYDKRPLLQYVMLALCFSLLLSGMKRGAIVIGAICLVLFVGHYVKYKRNSLKKGQKMMVAIAFLALVLLGYYYIGDLINNNVTFNNRIEQTIAGDSSGRDMIYSRILDHLYHNSSWIQLLFGSGAKATVKYIGIEAHNDWLEISMCQGLLGVILFALYWISFFKTWKSMQKKTLERFALGLLFVMCFLRTLFSMSILDMPIYTTCILGYCMASTAREKRSIFVKKFPKQSKKTEQLHRPLSC